jgi:hypothetical protein
MKTRAFPILATIALVAVAASAFAGTATVNPSVQIDQILAKS